MNKKHAYAAVLVSALGYFVDVYDIVLFSAIRVSSLKALGLSAEAVTSAGLYLLDIQLAGMLLGGILWGMLGDKRGRVTVLFGSIVLYSLANLANAFVIDVNQYAVCRFFAGVGLAGELGAGITLASELISKEIRGYGTSIIAASGVLGGVLAGLVGDTFAWTTAYIVGCVMGLLLLLLRMSVFESGIFKEALSQQVSRGSLTLLFRRAPLRNTFFRVLFLGAPIWILIGLFMSFAPEASRALNIQGAVTAGKAILFFNVGFGLGDLSSGLLSQLLKSRKKALWVYLVATAAFAATYLSLSGVSAEAFYAACVLVGLGAGYWAMFLTVCAEQFGTNLRATVAVSAPNFVRGMVIPAGAALQLLKPSLGFVAALGIVFAISWVLAAFSLFSLKETFAKDLAFVER
jgi:putative MFS transporter